MVAKFSPQRTKSKRSTTTNTKFLPADVTQIINDPTFWSTLFELQNLLLPLCGFLNKLQKDAARLHEVLHVFAYTMKLFRELPDLNFSVRMVERLEKRWYNGNNHFYYFPLFFIHTMVLKCFIQLHSVLLIQILDNS